MTNTINFGRRDRWAGGGCLADRGADAGVQCAAGKIRPATIALLPLALAGACAGFLLFNFPPARVFHGR